MQAVPTRWLGLLCLLLAFDTSSAVAQGASRAHPAFDPLRTRLILDPAPSGVAADSIVLPSPWFSPNDDGVLDTLEFAVAVSGPARAVVQIATAGQGDTLVVVLNEWKAATGRVNVPGSWDGRDTDGVLVPDGLYDLRVIEGDSLLTSFTTNTRRFEVDTVSPQIDSVRIVPSPYTPTLSSTPTTLQIRFWLARTQLDDSAGVEILHGEDTLQVALTGGFNGDGGYVAPCTTCADELEDGLHHVELFAFDRAGNEVVVVDSVDTNLHGPAVSLSHPTRALEFSTMQADSIVGVATDRQAVQSVSLLVSGALDTTLALSATPGPDSTRFGFALDVAALFAAEGVYAMAFPALDVDGVSDSTRTLLLRVDRTVPPEPILSPPLPGEIRTETIDARVLVDTLEASRLLIDGAAIPINPQTINKSILEIALPLVPGPNLLSFRTEDAAGNLSTAVTATVVRLTSEGISAPEQFKAGNTISIIPGQAASAVQVRILALDGSLVRQFEDPTSRTEYDFTWDLTTPEGLRARNGAYLLVAIVRGAGGTQRYHKMIAVIE